jgi:NADH-quinone oxidoreductase subunit J
VSALQARTVRASGVAVISFSNPFYSALALIGNLASLAVLYLLSSAEFVAAAQVLVYAGAVMVMFLFVIAYLGGRANEPVRSRPWWQTAAALAAAIAVVAEIGFAVDQQAFGDGAHVSDLFGAPQAIAGSFLGRYVLAFEATSVLLLIAAGWFFFLATYELSKVNYERKGGTRAKAAHQSRSRAAP